MEEVIDQRVAIAGATGYMGDRLVPRLLEDGSITREARSSESTEDPCGIQREALQSHGSSPQEQQ